MKISIIIPTFRKSYSALARVLELADLNPADFEVIVRDNSEDPQKREFLLALKAPAVRALIVPNLGGFENSIKALEETTGDFVQFLADDDWISMRGLRQLHAVGADATHDPAVSGLTGDYLIETSNSTSFFRFEGLESPDAVERLSKYLAANGPNLLYYAAMRRDPMLFCFRFMDSLPYKFSFHDQLMTLLYLVMGRFARIERAVYYYDLGEWETSEGTLSKDRASYVAAGLPIELDRLHWLICGLEGALLLKSNLLAQRVAIDRPKLMNIWFSTNFARFKNWSREFGYAEGSANTATHRVKDKWAGAAEINLDELLLDLCDVFENVDKPGAERYFKFWSTL